MKKLEITDRLGGDKDLTKRDKKHLGGYGANKGGEKTRIIGCWPKKGK